MVDGFAGRGEPPLPSVLLLVEDDPDHAFLVRRQLAGRADLGLRVEHVTTAAAAVLRLGRPGVGCVLLDLSLPDAQGMDALDQIFAVAPLVPVVVLTGLDSEAVGVQALQAGAQDYLVKGQHAADALARSVRFAMERARRQVAEQRQQALGTRLEVREAQLVEAQRLAGLGSWEWDVATGQVSLSHELQRLIGLPDLDGAVAFATYLGLVDDEDRVQVARLFSLADAGRQAVVVRHRLHPVDGALRWVLGHMTAAAWDADGRPVRVLGTMQDITEQKRTEDLIAHQAVHDSLTGLVNRTVLLDRLGRVLARGRGDSSMVAVVFLDLDQFKWVNDSHSHAAGDGLLVDVARRLTQVLRPGDTLARFGGDEFVVLCEWVGEESDVLDLVTRLTTALEPPFCLQDIDQQRIEGITVTVSAGVATAVPGTGVVAELLVRDADIAMYRAKERGRARYELFDEGMRDRATERLRTHQELQHALATDGLEVHFQPVVDPRTGAVTGSEALVRWPHPDRGLLLPDAFIPLAEQTGLIVPLGAMVLRQACATTAGWNLLRREPLTVAVNLSARQLGHPSLLADVAEALAESGLPPHLLCVEVTETVVMEDAAESARLLGQLRELGVQVAIDDFGTGYSSLAYLLTLPLDVLKIERSFVAAMSESGGGAGAAIVTAVVALASSLSLGVVAEGVETAAQRDLLVALGVTAGQGWLWGQAVAPGEARWAREQPRPDIPQARTTVELDLAVAAAVRDGLR